MSAYQPAPDAHLGGTAASRPGWSWWPDRRPLPTRRQHVAAVGSALFLLVAPFAVDLLGGPPWRTLWIMTGLGVALMVQAGMDAARPDPGDRFAVGLYRCVHLLAPLALVWLVLLVAGPSAWA